jgi:hypothetical protein
MCRIGPMTFNIVTTCQWLLVYKYQLIIIYLKVLTTRERKRL